MDKKNIPEMDLIVGELYHCFEWYYPDKWKPKDFKRVKQLVRMLNKLTKERNSK